MDLSKLATSIESHSDEDSALPPVEKWDPPYCGDIGIRIARDGQWFSQGTPIGRAKLVRLFSTILKKEGDNYFLVTPVEKVAVTVEDVPFVITQWEAKDGVISVQTQCGDKFKISSTHPVELRYDEASETQIPYVNVRRNLWARIHQNVFYQWTELADIEAMVDGKQSVTLKSGDYSFPIGYLS